LSTRAFRIATELFSSAAGVIVCAGEGMLAAVSSSRRVRSRATAEVEAAGTCGRSSRISARLVPDHIFTPRPPCARLSVPMDATSTWES
jgi:hypothetical protein